MVEQVSSSSSNDDKVQQALNPRLLDFFIFVGNGGCMTLGEFLFGYGWFSPGYLIAMLLLCAYALWRTGGRNGK